MTKKLSNQVVNNHSNELKSSLATSERLVTASVLLLLAHRKCTVISFNDLSAMFLEIFLAGQVLQVCQISSICLIPLLSC